MYPATIVVITLLQDYEGYNNAMEATKVDFILDEHQEQQWSLFILRYMF